MKSSCLLFAILMLIACQNTKHSYKEDKSHKQCKSDFKVDRYSKFKNQINKNKYIYLDSLKICQQFESIDFNEKMILVDSNLLDYSPIAPLMAIDTINKKLYLNKEIISEVKRINAITYHKNEIPFARLQKNSLYTVSFLKDIITQLMLIEIIKTYKHLYSQVCLIKEVDNESEVLLKYKITHHYCTNDCNDETKKIQFKVDKNTGVISLQML